MQWVLYVSTPSHLRAHSWAQHCCSSLLSRGSEHQHSCPVVSRSGAWWWQFSLWGQRPNVCTENFIFHNTERNHKIYTKNSNFLFCCIKCNKTMYTHSIENQMPFYLHMHFIYTFTYLILLWHRQHYNPYFTNKKKRVKLNVSPKVTQPKWQSQDWNPTSLTPNSHIFNYSNIVWRTSNKQRLQGHKAMLMKYSKQYIHLFNDLFRSI